MGSQIAQQTALGGYDVWLTDLDGDQLARAVESNRKLLQRRVEKGQLSQEDATAAVGRVRTTTSLEEAVGASDFVFEAIVEKLPPKRELFGALDAAAPAHTILASNSSTIPISKLADATGRADRCCNTHFFHPELVMQLCGPWTTSQSCITSTGWKKWVLQHLSARPVASASFEIGMVEELLARMVWAGAAASRAPNSSRLGGSFSTIASKTKSDAPTASSSEVVVRTRPTAAVASSWLS